VKPRILFVDQAGVLGGAELSLLDIASHFADTSQVVLFADGPFRERLERRGVPVRVCAAPAVVSGVSRAGKLTQDIKAAAGVIGLARRVARLAGDYDVIYANTQKAFIVSAVAGKFARRPVIWHLRDVLDQRSEFSRLHRVAAIRLANYFCARVIANSQATAAALVACGGRQDRVRVVLNGIDPTPFQRLAKEEIDALRGQLGVAGVPTVGVFSRLAPWKGQHVLLEALSQLPGAHALLVGEALFGEQDYANTLRELAVKLGIADRVHFLGFRQDIPQLMSLVDVVAHTSVTPEPFGRVLVEGMLARRPVVAARAGGVLEIVEDGVTGLLVAPGDARGLASVLRDLFADPNKARALAEAGYATAIQRFSVEALLRGVTEQVSEVLALSRRG